MGAHSLNFARAAQTPLAPSSNNDVARNLIIASRHLSSHAERASGMNNIISSPHMVTWRTRLSNAARAQAHFRARKTTPGYSCYLEAKRAARRAPHRRDADSALSDIMEAARAWDCNGDSRTHRWNSLPAERDGIRQDIRLPATTPAFLVQAFWRRRVCAPPSCLTWHTRAYGMDRPAITILPPHHRLLHLHFSLYPSIAPRTLHGHRTRL